MTGVVLYDDAVARRFEPFALTRPVGELRAGALLIRERWELALGTPAIGFVGAPHLADFEEEGAPRALSALPEGALVANSRFAPSLRQGEDLRTAGRLTNGGRTVAVRLGRGAPDVDVTAPLDLDELRAADAGSAEVSGVWLRAPWELVLSLQPLLRDDIPFLGERLGARRLGAGDAILIGTHAVLVEAGATVEPNACFDVTQGPVLLRRGATVQAFTRVVGPCYVGEESLVTTDRVAACSIGPQCKVHGEMSMTVVLGHANKGHDGFVGHSYLGRWSNLGAGTTTSNLKNTYGPVSLWTPDGMRDTGMQFLGTMFGDHAKTAINTALTTGTVIGAGANVVGKPGKVVSPFVWGAEGEVFRLDKFLEVAARVMQRRSITLGEAARRQLAAAYAARWSA